MLLKNNIDGGSTISTTTITIPLFSSLPSPIQEATIDYFPLWILVGLAMYAIISITYGVVNFADCPDAAKEVERHVKEAKEEMKKRGIIE